ncbi:MAG: glycosyltransferase [Bacteroidales bacterium]|nr:glycosyltransferase [Bacteroidales bacterium]
MANNNILVLVPSPNSIGGVSHYYQQLRPYLPNNFRYFRRGVRYQYNNFAHLIYPLVFIWDIMRFFLISSGRRVSLILINTSFGITGIIRDSIFIRISKVFGKKNIVFFRGIDEKIISEITDSKLLWNLFRKTFLTVDEIWVLSRQFSDKLKSWGYKGGLRIETTLVDSALLEAFNIESIKEKYNNTDLIHILFMSRLEKIKGIYETIDSFRIFMQKYPNSLLHICGDGKEKNNILKYIGDDLNGSIEYKGYVLGQPKSEIFSKTHLFIFPSQREGMPNVVLEAMAFGVPVLTTKVGGISDFFEEGKMGFIINQKDPEKIAELMIQTLEDKDLCKSIASYNYDFAKKHYYVQIVAERIKTYVNRFL